MKKSNKVIHIDQIPRPVRQRDMNDILQERNKKREEMLKKMKEVWKKNK